MKIYDGKYILIGLLVFSCWRPSRYGSTTEGRSAARPKLDTPVISQMVKSSAFCPRRDDHRAYEALERMEDGGRPGWQEMYVASDGKTYEMSLQNECMRCHSNKAQFCDKCHDYAGLKKDDPYCWNCHIAPKENK